MSVQTAESDIVVKFRYLGRTVGAYRRSSCEKFEFLALPHERWESTTRIHALVQSPAISD